ncbi:MAG: glycosyltransferase N-terminal domain-containing protein [Candidatus Krumholzibacteria bacterium]|nr:glycosyltransferase N-terminal domain-containing protein [Candidatus Krumholzibacteria bacterium]
MTLQLAAYDAIIRLAAFGARAAAPFNDKIAEGLKGREGFKARWSEQALAFERKGRLIWFHVSSVGEFEQAKPVINLLSGRLGPSLEIALTFFSPSGMRYYRSFDSSKKIPSIKFLEYLPVDTAHNARFCLDTLRPDMLVFVKFDIWPNLLIEASRRKIPLVLVSGTLSPGSRRLSWAAKRFYGDLYSRLSAVAAISREDAERFERHSSGAAEITVAGDTRFDQVCQRVDNSSVKLPAAIAAGGRTWIIAGSTWPRDEEIVIPGFADLMRSHPGAGLIIVPHEPTKERLAQIRGALDASNLSYHLLSSLVDDSRLTEPVILADGVGYLAELYRAGVLAYVGGSFTTGVHNVMEPAVLKLSVFFGPRIDNSYEARKLVDLGSGKIVETARDFSRELGALISDPALAEAKGAAAAHFVRNHCGAAVVCVDLIEKYLKRDTQD